MTAWWLANVADVRVHRETKQRPLDRHAEERPHLIPLPAAPYDVAAVEYRVVNVEGFIAYRQNFYSVPWRHIGQAAAGAHHRDGTDRLRPARRGDRPPSPASRAA